jgi:hypothetical protein
MRKLIGCACAGALAVLMTGCVAPLGGVGGTYGMLYTDVNGAMLATSNGGASKVGSATSKGIICVATGDSSIKAACANGGITKISHVDYHVTAVLGVYVETTVTVYGE